MTHILLIIGGGIAAYKTPALIRGLAGHSIETRCLLTAGGAEFVAPLTLASLTSAPVYENLFDLKDEAEMGHIELSRQAALILVAPATADLIAKMANGLANDLASATLLASNKPIIIAPAMNVRMWENPATQRNIAQLQENGIICIGPESGDMACGEYGMGRMSEPDIIADKIAAHFAQADIDQNSTDLTGEHIIITAGPTHEPIDPVRYIANCSSGKQGYALASALSARGAKVSLISGPTKLAPPAGVDFIAVTTAQDMYDAVLAHLPATCAIMCAAVADWRVKTPHEQKLKKSDATSLTLVLEANPDILSILASHAHRPPLLIGFAAETENVLDQAREKLARKKCDWLVANDVSPQNNVFGGDFNRVHIIDANGQTAWAKMSKTQVAQKLAARIAETLRVKSQPLKTSA